MTGFIIRRFISMLVSAWIAVTVVFFLARITGDPMALMVPDNATEAEILAVQELYGLNDPLWMQYVQFLGNVAQADFGSSIRLAEPALTAVLRYMPATIQLAVASIAISVIVGVSLGILAALRPRSLVDSFTMIVALAGQAIPGFWLGLMGIMFIGVQLQWLPISGRGTPAHLIMPALVLSTNYIAAFARLTRTAMIEQLSQDYTRTSRSKGLRERSVVLAHVLPNAAIPVVTQIGLSFGNMLGGSVIIETIFAWPGVGRFALEAVYNRDFPVIQATVVLIAVIFLVINFLMDILYGFLDPRIRVG